MGRPVEITEAMAEKLKVNKGIPPISVKDDGSFSANLPDGRYQVLLSYYDPSPGKEKTRFFLFDQEFHPGSPDPANDLLDIQSVEVIQGKETKVFFGAVEDEVLEGSTIRFSFVNEDNEQVKLFDDARTNDAFVMKLDGDLIAEEGGKANKFIVAAATGGTSASSAILFITQGMIQSIGLDPSGKYLDELSKRSNLKISSDRIYERDGGYILQDLEGGVVVELTDYSKFPVYPDAPEYDNVVPRLVDFIVKSEADEKNPNGIKFKLFGSGEFSIEILEQFKDELEKKFGLIYIKNIQDGKSVQLTNFKIRADHLSDNNKFLVILKERKAPEPSDLIQIYFRKDGEHYPNSRVALFFTAFDKERKKSYRNFLSSGIDNGIEFNHANSIGALNGVMSLVERGNYDIYLDAEHYFDLYKAGDFNFVKERKIHGDFTRELEYYSDFSGAKNRIKIHGVDEGFDERKISTPVFKKKGNFFAFLSEKKTVQFPDDNISSNQELYNFKYRAVPFVGIELFLEFPPGLVVGVSDNLEFLRRFGTQYYVAVFKEYKENYSNKFEAIPLMRNDRNQKRLNLFSTVQREEYDDKFYASSKFFIPPAFFLGQGDTEYYLGLVPTGDRSGEGENIEKSFGISTREHKYLFLKIKISSSVLEQTSTKSTEVFYPMKSFIHGDEKAREKNAVAFIDGTKRKIILNG